MRKLLLQNKWMMLAGLFAASVSCSGSGENTAQTGDTAVVVMQASDTPAEQLAVAPVTAPAPQEKKEAREVKHYSQDNRALDSIKKQKAKDKARPPAIEIKHGSQDDRLLDSIKKSKWKGKN